jgi:hypothetical protein
MRKNALALCLGLLLGMKTSLRGIFHVIYLSIIAALWFKPAHVTWHLFSPVGGFHLPTDDGYRTGAIAIVSVACLLAVLIVSLVANDSYNDYLKVIDPDS